MPVQESQFGKLTEIPNGSFIGVGMFTLHEPEHVAPNEPIVSWRVKIVGRIRTLVVTSVFGSPPEHVSLHAHVAHHSAPGIARALMF